MINCKWYNTKGTIYVCCYGKGVFFRSWLPGQMNNDYQSNTPGVQMCTCLGHGILPNTSVKCSYLRAFTSTTIRKHCSPDFARPAARLHHQCVPPAKLLSVPDRAWTTVVATPTRCHWSRECGRTFKMAEIVCCDRVVGRRLSAVKTSAGQFNNKTRTYGQRMCFCLLSADVKRRIN